MGNGSSVTRDGGEEGTQEEGEVRNGGSFGSSLGEVEDLMGQSPSHSPRGVVQSPPLIFFPQVPLEPLQKVVEWHQPSELCMHNTVKNESTFHEEGIPTMITWSDGGKKVCIEGSWDNWRTKKPLQRSGTEFIIIKMLPSGCYRYRYIVDGEWKCALDIPWVRDEMGNVYNILDVKEYIPDDLSSVAGFEPPQSPKSSYHNQLHGLEDFTKEPPTVPPQLQLTILNTPPTSKSTCSLSRPPHVVLNHIYIQKGKGNQPAVALSETCRFLAKYVTVVLYKSM